MVIERVATYKDMEREDIIEKLIFIESNEEELIIFLKNRIENIKEKFTDKRYRL